MRITALRPPPEGAPGKSLAEGVAKVVCQVDGEPVGPAPCKPVELSGPRGRGTDQDKARGFPSGPGASNSAPYRGRIYDRNRLRLYTGEQLCARGWVHIREFESISLRQTVSGLTHSPGSTAKDAGVGAIRTPYRHRRSDLIPDPFALARMQAPLTSRPRVRTASQIAAAHRIAPAGTSKVASIPSPPVFTSLPRDARSSLRAALLTAAEFVSARRSPRKNTARSSDIPRFRSRKRYRGSADAS
jgi:hypothetical protein